VNLVTVEKLFLNTNRKHHEHAVSGSANLVPRPLHGAATWRI